MRSVDAFSRDVRHAAGRLVRDWRFSAAAVLMLGLGIGANTAIFSLINAALFRAQPLAEPERLVDIYQRGANAEGLDGNSYPVYEDIAAYTDVFDATTAALVPHGVTYMHDGALRPAVAEHTTASYLSVLGIAPTLGRWFTAAEDTPGAAVVAVVGHTAWMRKFRGDPSVVGRTVRIEGVPVTIVGVGPVGHNGTINVGIVTDFWLPISSLPALGAPARVLERRPDEAAFFVKARLGDGVTVAQAQAAMDVLGQRLASEYPKDDPGRGIGVFASSRVRVHPQMDAMLAPVASVVLGIVALVLAIACSNLATLLLVRGTARAREISIRLALGATRGQLVRYLLTESVLLAVAGGIAGCVVAWWAVRALTVADLPVVMNLSLDVRVLAYALALSMATGIAFGLAPALKTTNVDLVPTLRDDGESRTSGRRWLTLKNGLVVFQVAVSVVLLGVASIFVQMLTASRTQRVGFAVDDIAMLETDPRYAGYSGIEASNMAEDLRRRIAEVPGVESAALTRGLPMQVTGLQVLIDGDESRPGVMAGSIWAGTGFFDMLRIPILYGRTIDERDRPDTPRVAVVSESMARQYFGVVNAVGRRFRLERDKAASFEVIGVAKDTGTADLSGDLVDPEPQLFYRSIEQAGVPATTVVARTLLDPAGLASTMQAQLRLVDPSVPVLSARTMAQYLEESLTGTKTVASFVGALGVLGLCLAGVGLHALVAFAVSRRSREIGIRMALGAESRQVVWAVSRDVAVLTAVGTLIGLILSLLVILAFRGISPPAPGLSLYRPTADPMMLGAIAGFMAAVAAVAASVPAWRAARLDPVSTLRRD